MQAESALALLGAQLLAMRTSLKGLLGVEAPAASARPAQWSVLRVLGQQLLAVHSQVAAGRSIPFLKLTGDRGRMTWLGPLQVGPPLGSALPSQVRPVLPSCSHPLRQGLSQLSTCRGALPAVVSWRLRCPST